MSEKTWSDYGIHLPRTSGGGEVRTTCPKCSPTRKPGHQNVKCLSCNLDNGSWYCHHCLKDGGLVMGWSDDEPLHQGGFSRRERTKEWTKPPPMPTPDEVVWEKSKAWFAGRGISEDTLRRAGVTAVRDYCPACAGDVGRIYFPYFVDGEHINTKKRCAHKHFALEGGAQRVLYNQDVAKAAMLEHDLSLIIVEGEMDALSLMEAGYDNVVSVPNGAPDPKAKNYATLFSFLGDAEALITSAKTVVLATDSDAPGRTLMNELARRIGPEKCLRVLWDEGIKDANECLTQVGPEYLQTCIETAEPFPVEGIFTGLDLLSDLLDLYDHGHDPGVKIGYHHLDAHYRIKTGQISIVTGIPNHGKSAVMDQFFVKLAENHDWRFAIFSPEQQPLVLHQRNLIEIHSRMPFSEGPTDRMTRNELIIENQWVSERFAFILPDSPDLNTILELAKVQVFRTGCKGIVIDPFNEVETQRPKDKSMTEYVGDCLRLLKKFARDYDVHVWVVAHPTKMQRPKDPADPEPVPGLWDISDSAHWRNKADFGLTVWRDMRENHLNEVQVHILKVRWKPEQGDIGAVRFKYNPANKTLSELGPVVFEN